MTADIVPFNPLDKKNLGASVAEALLAGTLHPLGVLPSFYGAGIYAIYYGGSFPAYAELAKRNRIENPSAPIYIGKAIPSGARRGTGTGLYGKSLFNRLSEHAESIASVGNLNVEDFACRYLVVDDIWIPLGESLLITRYAPVWNSLLDGFGNHDPGSGRYGGLCPRWDVLHPGRVWATRCRSRHESAADIQRDVEAYLRSAPFPTSDRFIEPFSL